VRVDLDQRGPQSDPLEEAGDPFAAFVGGADPVNDQWLANDIAGRHSRVERGVGILIDHLHLPAVGQHPVLVEIGDVLAANPDFPGGRLEQFEKGAAGRRLAATALPDEPQRFAAVDVKRDAVDRVDLTGRPGEQAGMDREMLFEPLDLEEPARFIVAPAKAGVQRPLDSRLRGNDGIHLPPSSTCSACQQATQWPGRYCTIGG